MADTCPICQRDDLGCAVRDEGAFCRAPARRLSGAFEPPAPAALASVRRLDTERRAARPRRSELVTPASLVDFLGAVGVDTVDPEVVRRIVGVSCAAWGNAIRRRYTPP